MKTYVQFYYHDEATNQYREILGMDGIRRLDGRLSPRNREDQAERIADRLRAVQRIGGYQIYRGHGIGIGEWVPVTAIIRYDNQAMARV